MVCFRLSDPEYGTLLALSEQAGIGHSTLARRIVEHYINEHAPRNRHRR
jgi:predicted DNA-binding protein